MKIACCAQLIVAMLAIPAAARTEVLLPATPDITQMEVVHTVPGMERANVRRNLAYRTVGDQTLEMDVYSRPDAAARLPAVIHIRFSAPFDGSSALRPPIGPWAHSLVL